MSEELNDYSLDQKVMSNYLQAHLFYVPVFVSYHMHYPTQPSGTRGFVNFSAGYDFLSAAAEHVQRIYPSRWKKQAGAYCRWWNHRTKRELCSLGRATRRRGSRLARFARYRRVPGTLVGTKRNHYRAPRRHRCRCRTRWRHQC